MDGLCGETVGKRGGFSSLNRSSALFSSHKVRMKLAQALGGQGGPCGVCVHRLYNEGISPLWCIQRHLWVCSGVLVLTLCQGLPSGSRAGRRRVGGGGVFPVDRAEDTGCGCVFLLPLLVGSMSTLSQVGGWLHGPVQCVSVSVNLTKLPTHLRLRRKNSVPW